MEYLNDRLVLLSRVAHTRGRIEQATNDGAANVYLLALLDQQEAALHDYDAQIKAQASDVKP